MTRSEEKRSGRGGALKCTQTVLVDERQHWEGFALSSPDIKDSTELSGQTRTHMYRSEQPKHSSARTHTRLDRSAAVGRQNGLLSLCCGWHHACNCQCLQLCDPTLCFYLRLHRPFLYFCSFNGANQMMHATNSGDKMTFSHEAKTKNIPIILSCIVFSTN